jgi:hypothetical protein
MPCLYDSQVLFAPQDEIALPQARPQRAKRLDAETTIVSLLIVHRSLFSVSWLMDYFSTLSQPRPLLGR